jgi:hypothetical protein
MEPVVPDEPADGLLQALVGWINGTNGELPISVAAGGMLLSGQLISHRTYREQLADLMIDEDSRKKPGPGGFYERMRESGEMVDPERQFEPQYYHMRDVVFRSGGTAMSVSSGSAPVLWRGRLSRVDAFFLGRLG